jgi:hypothetical protein
MAEELIFEEAFGNCTTIDRDKWPSCSAAHRVNRFANQFLARTALPIQADGGICYSDLRHLPQHVLHLGAGGDNVARIVAFPYQGA